MRLEDQVTSLELSKRLKELGVKQESLFRWKMEMIYFWQSLDRDDLKGTISAFTVAELGEMLPEAYEVVDDDEMLWFEIEITKDGGVWKVAYYQGNKDCEDGVFTDDTEANARAKMLIYLLENKLIKND